MKAETAAILAVFGYLKNSNVFFSGPNKDSEEADILGSIYRTHITYSWQDQNQEFHYSLSLVSYDHETERMELEIRSNNDIVRAELKKEATQQYSINFSNSSIDNSDVIPWFKIDEAAKYIHDGYHQNADAGEEGPFTGSIELKGLRSVLKGYYNNQEVQYIVKIIK
jgi:hypothetical protein